MARRVGFSNRRVLRSCMAVLAGVLGAATAAGQGVGSSATLPESNEAMILSSRVEEALATGDFRLAIRLVEQITELPAELVSVPDSRTYYPVWRQAVRLLRQLPPAGVQIYQQLYDGEVSARFETGAAAGDVAALRELFHRYPVSSSWPAIGQELIAQLLDREAFGEAVEVIRELQTAKVPQTPVRRAQWVVALAGIGLHDAAAREFDELAREPALQGNADWELRLGAIRGWLDARRPGAALAASGAFEPLLNGAARWNQPLASAEGGFQEDDDALADAAANLRRLPLQQPVCDAGTLVVRLRGMVRAYDALTLVPRWQVKEIAGGDEAEALPMAKRRMRGWPGEDFAPQPTLSRDAELLLNEPLRHALAAGRGLVYSIEALASLSFDLANVFVPSFQGVEGPAPNDLVARELATGRQAWRVRGTDATDPLSGYAFQDAPLVAGERLIVPAVKGGELSLLALNAATGKLERQLMIVGPPTNFPPHGGRCMTVADETTIYVCTGNGVVAAVSRDSFQWKWAATYPSQGVEPRLPFLPRSQTPAREFGFDRPVLAQDLLILAPVDSPVILALDRFGGQERWRADRGEFAYLLGTSKHGLIVGGSHVACVDLADGRTIRWRSAPMEAAGRGAVLNERLYLPTRAGLLVLDCASGRIVADNWNAEQDLPRPLPAANLVIAHDAVFAASPGQIEKFPDPAATAARAEEAAAAEHGAERAALARAWLALLEREYNRALALLEELKPGDEGRAAARDRLLSSTLVALSRESGETGEKLAWLNRALELPLPPDAAAGLAALVGQALEEAGRWDDALQHYQDLLVRGQAGLLQSVRDPDHRIAGWLHAAGRLNAILPARERAKAGEFADGLAAAARATKSAAALLRVRSVVSDPVRRAALDQALVLARAAPELAIDWLPEREEPGLPLEERRKLHIERWETHVALGLLEAAKADAQYWRAELEGAGVAESQPAESEAESADAGVQRRIERIERAARKLEQAADTPFRDNFRKQWSAADTELIVDLRDPLRSMRSVLLTRDLQKRQIALRDVRNGSARQEAPDALRAGAAQEVARQTAVLEMIFEGDDPDTQTARRIWPAATWGYRAVLPITGGIACTGLGIERGAGKRLWEFEIADWTEPPPDYSERTVVAAEGVFLAVRKNRVLAVDWYGGQVLWQRDFPGVTILGLTHAGGRLLVVSDTLDIFSMDARYGDDLRRYDAAQATPRAVRGIGELVLIFSEQGVGGYDPATFQPRWFTAGDGFSAVCQISGRDWVGLRARTGGPWRLLDARTGAPAIARELADVPDEPVTAAYCDGRQLLLATHRQSYGEGTVRHTATVLAFDAADGALRWQRPVQTFVPINVTQLAAHVEYVPVLILNGSEGTSDRPDLSTLAIRLVRKEDGEALDSRAISREFAGRREPGDVYLLVTPTRMIVQAASCLAAYGNSASNPAP